jgi:acyl carrier protein
MNDLKAELERVFRRVFDDDDIQISEATTATDVDGWDSMAHINLIIAIEKQFGVKFAAGEIASLSRRGQTVGSMLQMLATKTGRGTL